MVKVMLVGLIGIIVCMTLVMPRRCMRARHSGGLSSTKDKSQSREDWTRQHAGEAAYDVLGLESRSVVGGTLLLQRRYYASRAAVTGIRVSSRL